MNDNITKSQLDIRIGCIEVVRKSLIASMNDALDLLDYYAEEFSSSQST